MTLGKSVRLFLADGTPGGLITAEIMNWTGHVLSAQRSDLPALLKRPEVSRTGVYLLLGDDPDSPGGVLVYVGEGDDVGKRLASHARSEDANGKDFWDRAVVLTSKDANLTKAHVRYLESRLISLIREAGRARLVNGTAPPPIPLPEADVSDMEFYVEQAKLVLPVLSVNLLRTTTVVRQPVEPTPHPTTINILSPVFTMTTKDGAHATAQEVDGEFVVRAGSTARRHASAASWSYSVLRQQLEHEGVLSPTVDDTLMTFTRDYAFSSVSAAGACVQGRASNGRVEWRVGDTPQTYAQWQESLLPDTTAVDTE